MTDSEAAARRGTCRRAAACSRKAVLLSLSLILLLVPASCGSDEAVHQDEGGARFPRFFNAKTMRVVGKEDAIPTDGYAAFIPAARPSYDARMDVSLPLARRINAGYRLPNVFRPGEWAPLRRFCAAPQQEENANGLLQSTRHSYQPVSWYTVLKALFGIPPLTSGLCTGYARLWPISAANLFVSGAWSCTRTVGAAKRTCGDGMRLPAHLLCFVVCVSTALQAGRTIARR